MQDLYRYRSNPGNVSYLIDHADHTAPTRQHELDHTGSRIHVPCLVDIGQGGIDHDVRGAQLWQARSILFRQAVTNIRPYLIGNPRLLGGVKASFALIIILLVKAGGQSTVGVKARPRS